MKWKLILKVLVSGVFLILVFRKIDISHVHTDDVVTILFLLPFITLLYAVSKYFSALRQYALIRNEGFQINKAMNFRLYWIGMYYNILLPGGIGGDAVKVYRLRKELEMPAKKGVRILLLDRISGLLVLSQLACLLAFVLKVPLWTINGTEWLLGLSVSWIMLYFAHRILSKRNLSQMWSGWLISLSVQVVQLIEVTCMVWILNGNVNDLLAFLLAFLVSSVVSSLPVSIGGIGLREYCFFLTCSFFDLPVDIGILISLLFFISSLLASIPGAFIKMDKQKDSNPDREKYAVLS